MRWLDGAVIEDPPSHLPKARHSNSEYGQPDDHERGACGRGEPTRDQPEDDRACGQQPEGGPHIRQ
jgi:hypothetical protein